MLNSLIYRSFRSLVIDTDLERLAVFLKLPVQITKKANTVLETLQHQDEYSLKVCT
jgi:hypothetical protein